MLNLSYFKSCIFCGSIIVQQPSCCKSCLGEIRKRVYAPRVLVSKGVLIRPLFLWNEPNNIWLRHLVYSLKGGGCKFEQTVLASLFLYVWAPKVHHVDFYCAPGSKEDHAFEWSKAVTEKLGTTFQSPFIKKSPKQKEKTKKEREGLEVTLGHPVMKSNSAKKAIFLDDIVATGNTAYKSLGLLEGYVFNEVWCIAYKEHCSD